MAAVTAASHQAERAVVVITTPILGGDAPYLYLHLPVLTPYGLDFALIHTDKKVQGRARP